MTALAVIGFIFINAVGLIFLPRVLIMGYVWYVLIQWKIIPDADKDALWGLLLLVISILAVTSDFLQIYKWFEKE